MIRVVIVDDHAVVRAGLTQLLGATADIEVLAAVGDAPSAVQAVRDHDPDVVLMDLQLPGEDGVSATRQITASGARAQVVVLTSFSDSERIVGAIDAGAVGYLLKDAEPADLVAGVEAAGRGESPLHPLAARRLLSARARGGGGADTLALTSREREVLRLVRDGLANKQIARRLSISERTVKAHLTSAFQRIGVSDRTQAALWVQRNDL